MKKLLILLILSLCAVAWRSDDIVNALTTGTIANATASASHQNAVGPHAMSIDELSFLSKTDPQSGRKFLASRTVSERNAADKLMNFFSRGSYE